MARAKRVRHHNNRKLQHNDMTGMLNELRQIALATTEADKQAKKEKANGRKGR